MFKRILVPLDGSGRAEQALSVAARLARAADGSLVLVRVVNTAPEHLPSAPARPNLVQTVGEADRKQAESYLEGVVGSEQLDGIPVETMVLTGLVAPSILSAALSQRVDLIVICSHGFTGVKRWVMGSVADKIAHYSEIPVLVLREDGPLLGARQGEEIRALRALVPLDGSEYARAALLPAAYLASALSDPGKGALHLVHVVRTVANGRGKAAAQELQFAQKGAEQYLEETTRQIEGGFFAPVIASLNLTLTSSVTTSEDVAQAIIRMAERGEGGVGAGASGSCDAIVMTTHGYSGLHRWAVGSITGRVLLATHLPLLIVRPADFATNR
jgi:nucleotide-binding universal stress UspA family protein